MGTISATKSNKGKVDIYFFIYVTHLLLQLPSFAVLGQSVCVTVYSSSLFLMGLVNGDGDIDDALLVDPES